MQDVYIIAACRTPIGKMGGALKTLSVADLTAAVLEEVVKRGGVNKNDVDEIVMGETRPSSSIHNVARYTALKTGFPVTTTGYTIQQACCSGMTAVECAMNKIMVGMADLVIAGGVESMSNAPFFTTSIRYGTGAGDLTIRDSITESQIGAQPSEIYGRLGMGAITEELAESYGITREESDALSHSSQLKYQAAYEAGKFDEIVPVSVPQRKGDPIIVDKDEHPRLTSPEKLASLKPSFTPDGQITPGNASGRNDGACVLLLAGEEKMKALHLKPMAKIVGYSIAGVDPRVMGIGPVPAVKKVMEKTGLQLEDMDLIELNEAFACQALACVKELGIDPDKLNVNGGAVALGHPSGATGARLITTLCYELHRRPEARYGLATLCVGGGMGNAVIIEKV